MDHLLVYRWADDSCDLVKRAAACRYPCQTDHGTKITGESLGVSAFTTLAFMIVSLSLFGVAGVILSPVLIILLKALYTQGYFQRWIRKPEDEYAQGRSPTTGP